MISMEEVILGITYAMYRSLNQDQINELKSVLYMHLGKYQLTQEETSVSTLLDDTVDKINMFFATLQIEGRTEKTIKAYVIEYRLFFNKINKNYKDITTNDIRMYLADCKTNRHNSDVTINNRIHNLMSLFKWLTAEGYINKNPMLQIHIAKVEKKVKEVLSDEQAEIVRCSCEEERDKAIIDTLTCTGIRVGELVKLNRSDVDFINGQFIVYGKGRKERVAYINGKATVHLMWYLEQRTDENPALFVGLREPHERITESGIRAIMNRLSKAIKVQNIHLYPHKMRRTMATNMLNKGAHIEHVQQLLGHASPQTTQGYWNLSQQVIKDAYRKYAG